MTDYAIDKVSWHTRSDPDPAFHERVRLRFQAVARFLQSNNLAKTTLLPDGVPVNDAFEINTSSLTDEGRQFMKQAYSKWQKAQNKGKSPTDVTILQKELARLRGQTF